LGDTIRLRISTKDRVGMALDILKILYNYGVNLKALEVGPGLICVKMDSDFDVSLSYLLEQLRAQKDVIEVSVIKLLPQEKREKHIKAVLDATGEGIIAIDREGIITTFNPAAEKILKVDAKDALGKDIADLISSDIPMLCFFLLCPFEQVLQTLLLLQKALSSGVQAMQTLLSYAGTVDKH
jgi:transcriptional regulator of aromatic amino acid metabolism